MMRTFGRVGLGTGTVALVGALVVAASWLGGCSALSRADGDVADPSVALDRLVAAMTGSFSSAAQSESDPRFRHVVLHMTPIAHLDAMRPGTRWLYVEQAMAETPERPYRQRVYRVSVIERENAPPLFESAVFEFDGDPLRFAGAWRDPSRLWEIVPAMLTERRGCAVLLESLDDAGDRRWIGATEPGECATTFGGAAYTTSEVEIRDGEITTWDRGYDTDGVQVWGSTAGAYVFRR